MFGQVFQVNSWVIEGNAATEAAPIRTNAEGIYFFIYACMCIKSLHLCLTLFHPMDSRLPGSSVHMILQARILEWIAMSSPRGSSQPRD